MKLKRIGVDLAKNVFQVHGVDSHEQVKLRKQVKRRDMLNFFRQMEPCVVAMEACGGSHYWAREFGKMGHEVRLIAPQFVKPYVKSGKNDANDAEGICEAASRPAMRYVRMKTPAQQAGQALHRVRSRLIGARTALVNEIRGLLSEFGIIGPIKGVAACRRLLGDVLEDAENGLPGIMRELLAHLLEELGQKDAHLARLDGQIKRQCARRAHRAAHGDRWGGSQLRQRPGRGGGRCTPVQERTRPGSLAGVGTESTLQRRQGQTGIDLQAG